MSRPTITGPEVPKAVTGYSPTVTNGEQARPAQKDYYVPELDGLRGLAAIGAVVYHYLWGPGLRIPVIGAIQTILEAGPVALDTFFVLSGFLIGGILLRTRESANYYKTFYVRRAYRILPLYYAWLAVYIVLFFSIKGWGMRASGYSAAFTLTSFAFLFQNFFPTILESTYIVAPTWTLAVEEHFYLLAPLCVRRLSRRRLAQFLIAVIALAPVLRAFLYKFVGHANVWSQNAIRVWSPCRADALAFGVLLALVWTSEEMRTRIRKYSRFLPLSMFVFTAIGTLFFYFHDAKVPHTYVLTSAFGRTVMELACLSLLIFVLARPEASFCKFLRSDAMRWIGKISYCLYLVHWGILWAVSRFLFHSEFGFHLWFDLMAAPIAILLSFLVAGLSWKYLESPLIRKSHRFKY